jgi:hypothetical protein
MTMAAENVWQHGSATGTLAWPRRSVPADVTATLDVLAAGALHWIHRNLEFFDPTSGNTELPKAAKAKAALELALLCHHWTRLEPGDEGLAEATAILRRVWRWPDFVQVIAAATGWVRQYELVYGALAPDGITDGPHQDTLAKLAAEGYLESPGTSPAVRLETRYYADIAGVSHRMEPYDELYESSLLATRTTALPVTHRDAYDITHSVFYLTDFGFRDPGLTGDERERALRIIGQLTDHCVRRDEWDLAAEFILAQFCLGADPVRTPSGAAGIARLAQAQLPDGAIPGRSPAQRAADSATAVDFFRKAYHTTLVTALASLIISRVPQSY